MSYRGWHCCYCKRALDHPSSPSRVAMTWDHVVPQSRGGRRVVPCCRQCNNLKGDLDPDLWRLITTTYTRWWKEFTSHPEVRREANRLAKLYRRSAAE